MKDAEAQILKAFLYALSQQTEMLSESVSQQIRAIAAALDTRVVELDDLAIVTPALELPYRTAYRWLTAMARERGMGYNFPPGGNLEPVADGEKSNIARDSRARIEDTQEFLDKIDQKLDQASRILLSSNPVETAKQEFS